MTTIDKLRTLLTDLDGLLLLDEQNRRYATRLHTSAGAVYITEQDASDQDNSHVRQKSDFTEG